MMVLDLDEGLEPDEKEVLESHLRDCPSCSSARETFSALLTSVAVDVPPDLKDEFWKRYDSSLAAAIREKETSSGVRWSFRWKVAGALLAAAFVFAAVFTGFYDFQTPKIEDRRVSSQLLIEELNDLYGPSSEDFLPALQYQTVLTELKTSRAKDTFAEWFEEEDEAGPLWL